jgi:hypothetical protein
LAPTHRAWTLAHLEQPLRCQQLRLLRMEPIAAPQWRLALQQDQL